MSHVNAAIRKCLEQCSQSDDPLGCLATHIAELRAMAGWQEQEITDVETTTRRILAGLTNASESSTSELALWD